MHLDRFASVFVAQPLRSAGLVARQPGIPVLMYHSVSDDPETGVAPYFRLTTSPARFREQMRWLHANGFEAISMDEVARRVEDGTAGRRRAVAITFDDGFRDFSTNAWPILSEFGFSATMFLPTDFIARSPRAFKGRECLTWSEVRSLAASGAWFGSHTASHPILYGLGWQQIRDELVRSRASIEHELQQQVRSFAYPYAFPQEDRAYATRFGHELAHAGYRDAVTTIVGRVGVRSKLLALERLPVSEADDLKLFETKVGGAYDWIGTVQLAMRRARRRLRARPS